MPEGSFVCRTFGNYMRPAQASLSRLSLGFPSLMMGEFFEWSGSVYVEYDEPNLLTPNRLEWSGSISKIEPTVIGHYLLSTDDTMGPIDPNATGSTPTFPSH